MPFGAPQLADPQVLHDLVEPHAQALGFDLVRVKLGPSDDGRVLQIMAERPDTRQLTLDDCSALSKRVSEMLDADDPIEGAYRLEVSSPGIDRPLTRPKDFADWAGHEAKLMFVEPMDGRKTVKAELHGLDGDAARVGELRVPLANIKSAKLVLTDKLIAATAPLDIEGADETDDTQEEED